MSVIYLDNAATTKICPEALAAMLPWLTENYGNASAVNKLGRDADEALRSATAICAEVLNCQTNEIFFTSGATESNNWVIKSAIELGKKKKKWHIITSAIEHPSVLNPIKTLEKQGYNVSYLPVDSSGQVDPADVEAVINEGTALVSIMYVNNEIGTAQKIKEVGEICRKYGVLFHTDATQAISHLPVNVYDVDMLTLSGHKFHAPKGTGLLYVNRNIDLPPLIEGGKQQRGKRSGTENVAGIMGFAAAIKETSKHMFDTSFIQAKLINGLTAIEGVTLNCGVENTLYGIYNFLFKDVNAEALMLELEMRGIIVSAGSACSSGSLNASHVLKAIGLSDKDALSCLRFSLSRFNTPQEIDRVLEIVPEAVEKIRRFGKIKNAKL